MSEVVNDLKAKRDALSLAHEQLKKDNDDWNKCIIVLSLFTGMFESMKIKMGWNNNLVALVPIALSSIIASISALIKFKKFPEQMETLIQSTSLLTNTLNKCRNHDILDHEILVEYNDALEKLETSVYPDIRKKYLKMSQKNLIDIMKIEQTYFKNIELVNKGEKIIQIQDDESSKEHKKINFITNPLAKRQESSISTIESNKKTMNENITIEKFNTNEHTIIINPQNNETIDKFNANEHTIIIDPQNNEKIKENIQTHMIDFKPEPLDISNILIL